MCAAGGPDGTEVRTWSSEERKESDGETYRESDGAAVFTGGFLICSGSSGSHYHSLFRWSLGAQGGDVRRGGFQHFSGVPANEVWGL